MVPLPLSALLSQMLVAFTIECDNEFERQMPHRTTNHESKDALRQGPWLVSMVMWWNCMRFVGEHGLRARELEELAGTKTNLNGMQRWGYIVIGPDQVIRATPQGRKAQAVWLPLAGAIEKRWQERFGQDEIQQLRKSLGAVIEQIPVDLPDCLPILGYGLFSRAQAQTRPSPDPSGLDLPALLSRALLAFAIEFERESELSLAISANVLRVLDEDGVRVRDLPQRSGVSKEAIAVAMGILEKQRLAVVAPDQVGGRAKVARLTKKGGEAQEAYRRLVRAIEERWSARFGKRNIRALSDSLARLAGQSLWRGLEPYPDGWRASVPKPSTLPHYPMVLHRGGFPDGS